MPNCCPEILDTNALPVGGVSMPYGTLTNVVNTDGVLTRSGGLPGTSDAFGVGANWCPGTGCALWYWKVTNTVDDHESNLINYFIEPEDPVTGVDGWGLSNQFVPFRCGEFLNSLGGALIHYGNLDRGFNYFAIVYNNGSVRLYQTTDAGLDDPGWVIPHSFARVGLPTNTRYRLRVTVKPSAIEARSSEVFEIINETGTCELDGTTDFTLPRMMWSATAHVGDSLITPPRVYGTIIG